MNGDIKTATIENGDGIANTKKRRISELSPPPMMIPSQDELGQTEIEHGPHPRAISSNRRKKNCGTSRQEEQSDAQEPMMTLSSFQEQDSSQHQQEERWQERENDEEPIMINFKNLPTYSEQTLTKPLVKRTQSMKNLNSLALLSSLVITMASKKERRQLVDQEQPILTNFTKRRATSKMELRTGKDYTTRNPSRDGTKNNTRNQERILEPEGGTIEDLRGLSRNTSEQTTPGLSREISEHTIYQSHAMDLGGPAIAGIALHDDAFITNGPLHQPPPLPTAKESFLIMEAYHERRPGWGWYPY
mmetsp:Transcript_9063/g.21603  ORF Transcript_9063/g.21603 Transcript_9063/m.21603 type:complete len:303 (+) Transcript_9063:141-1049(+)|eukprot:CAMPEP_0201198998 /NCGR_PEP_ID=MMETSP0851-20130426/157984_1 /ASSEMBLY_ACC=CAM_ASM_000631 /TAXON_ID=183588 /ORGANISM="Pseudo-nitzschia fraudulenta, Strain WWA7" /LENGTH=302 /DNA_ID=CAMNT_0047486339 /DNA_START=132 /DNA_END=1040 /DNA_ORIENTATION=+